MTSSMQKLGTLAIFLMLAWMILCITTINVPDVGFVNLGTHATDRHGIDADSARSIIGSNIDTLQQTDEYITIPDIGVVKLGNHAIERHGKEALRARYLATQGVGGSWKCGDDGGKEYKITNDPLDTAKWGIVICYNKVECTSMMSHDRSYIQRVLEQDKCWPIWKFGGRWGHP